MSGIHPVHPKDGYKRTKIESTSDGEHENLYNRVLLTEKEIIPEKPKRLSDFWREIVDDLQEIRRNFDEMGNVLGEIRETISGMTDSIDKKVKKTEKPKQKKKSLLKKIFPPKKSSENGDT